MKVYQISLGLALCRKLLREAHMPSVTERLANVLSQAATSAITQDAIIVHQTTSLRQDTQHQETVVDLHCLQRKARTVVCLSIQSHP
jgi:hypothetical protein